MTKDLTDFLATVPDGEILDREKWDATAPDIQYEIAVAFAKRNFALQQRTSAPLNRAEVQAAVQEALSDRHGVEAAKAAVVDRLCERWGVTK